MEIWNHEAGSSTRRDEIMNFLTSEFLDMTYPDKYYQDVINPAKTGKGQVPSKMQMLSKAQPFKAMRIGIDPYLPKSMQTGYDAFRAAPTTGAARFLGSNIAGGLPLAYAYGADKLQQSIPEELQGVMSEDIISQGAMGAAAGQNPDWDAILRGVTANVPAGITRPGMERLDPTDANYIPRQTMEANYPDAIVKGQSSFLEDRNLLQKGWDYAMNTNLGQKMRTGYNIGKEKYVLPTIGIMGAVANHLNPLNPQSRNYNPDLQGQIDQLQASGHLGGHDPSGPYKITSGPLEGKNLVSGFGTNDYDKMLAKKISWFEKRKAEKKSISDKAYQEALEEQKRREEQKRTQGTNIGGGWTRKDLGGGRATFTGSGGQSHQGWSNTPAGFAAAAASEGSHAEGGLAGLWRR